MRTAFVLCLALLAALAIAPDAAQAAPWAGIAPLVDTLAVGTSWADLGTAVATGLPFALLPGHAGLLFDKPDDSGGGMTRADVEAIAADAIKRAAGSGDAPDLSAVARLLADEKEKTAAARRELAEARAKIPADGAVVLTGTEAEAYTTLKARDGFGAAPLAKAAETLDANQAALDEAATAKAAAAQEAAFRAAGLDPAKVRTYVPGLDARLDGEGDDAKPVAVVTAADGTVSTVPLADHMAATHAEILPVLQGSAATPAQKGGAVLPQGSAAGAAAPAGDLVGDRIAKAKAALEKAA